MKHTIITTLVVLAVVFVAILGLNFIKPKLPPKVQAALPKQIG